MKTGIHIIIYSPYPNCAGGRENWINQFYKNINRNKYDLHIYTFKSAGQTKQKIENLHKTWIPQSIIQNRKTTHNIATKTNRKSLLSICIRYCYEILIFLSILYFGLVAALKLLFVSQRYQKNIAVALGAYIEPRPVLLIKKIKNIKLLTFVRGMLGGEIENAKLLKPSVIMRVELLNLKKSDTVLCNGKDIEYLLSENGIKSYYLHNAIDKNLYHKKAIVPSEIKNFKGKKIISVAALRDIKGIKNMVSAIPYIEKYYHKSFKVFFIGKGNSAKYKILAQQINCNNYTTFLGEKNNISDYMKSADLICCFSKGGGVPTVATEAKASKCLILADDSPIYRQEVRNNKTGYLVDKKNPADIGKIIAKALLSNNKTILSNAYKEAMSLPNWIEYVEDFEKTFLS